MVSVWNTPISISSWPFLRCRAAGNAHWEGWAQARACVGISYACPLQEGNPMKSMSWRMLACCDPMVSQCNAPRPLHHCTLSVKVAHIDGVLQRDIESTEVRLQWRWYMSDATGTQTTHEYKHKINLLFNVFPKVRWQEQWVWILIITPKSSETSVYYIMCHRFYYCS